MLKLSHFTKFPSIYKNREKSVNDVIFTNMTAVVTDDKHVMIKSSTNKYIQEIEVFDDKITLNSLCKVYCNCESFKFEFANSIFRNGSLLHPMSFIRSIVKKPKEKNEYNTASGCKHIVALARASLKIKTKRIEG